MPGSVPAGAGARGHLHPSPGQLQGTSPEQLQTESRWGLPQSSMPRVGPGWAGPLQQPHGSVSVLSPAATLKSKQGELHRKRCRRWR